MWGLGFRVSLRSRSSKPASELELCLLKHNTCGTTFSGYTTQWAGRICLLLNNWGCEICIQAFLTVVEGPFRIFSHQHYHGPSSIDFVLGILCL